MKNDGALYTQLLPYLLVAPTMMLILSFLVYPIARAFYLSFQNYNLTQAWKDGFTEFEDYQKLFHDKEFYNSLTITAKWILTQAVGQLVLGIVVALLLNQKSKGRGSARATSPMLWTIFGMLVTILWVLMYDQNSSLTDDMLIKSDIISKKVAWLAGSRILFPMVNIAELWRGVLFFTINILATPQSIPVGIYESSAINGCRPVKNFFYITPPYLEESIIFATLLRGIQEFSSIDMIFTMTNGGPMDRATALPIYMMKAATIKGNYGYGSAIGMIVFLILLVFATFYIRVSGFGDEENE